MTPFLPLSSTPLSSSSSAVSERAKRVAEHLERMAQDKMNELALEVNAKVYVCADKFGLLKLKEHATRKFMSRLEGSGNCAFGPF